MTLPVYRAMLNNEEDGIYTISWVTCPATEINMICFDKQIQKELKFTDDEKHLVTSVVMLADTKIYRRQGDFEYYITYEKDTLLKMCEKMLKDDTYKNISFEHNGQNIDKDLITLVELYTVDENKKSPFDIPNGSIVATYKVNNDEIWELFKSGELSGISLEGIFAIEEIEQKNNNQKYMSLKEKLKNIFMDFAKVATDKGVLVTEGELEIDKEVTDEQGEAIADGEYLTEDNKVITVKEGKVESIKEKEAEKPEEPEKPAEPQENAEEPTEPTEPAEDPNAEVIAELQEAVANLTAQLSDALADIAAIKEEISKPAAPGPEEDVVKNKFSRLGGYLKK